MGKGREKSGRLIAGASVTNITPNNSQFLYGYPFVERMSEGTHDPLLSAALYLANGNEQALLVSNDVIYVSKASVLRIRKEVSVKTGVPEGSIMISATHTHSGPVTVDCIISSNDPVVSKADSEYIRYFEDKIIEAACDSFNKAVPAKAGFLLADATGIGTNRHDTSGPADSELPAVVVKNLNDKFIACMLVCNMHPTVLHEDSKLYSGDFPAFAREILQKEYSLKGCPVIYFTGAAGNQSPRHVTRENTFNEARRIGEIVAAAVGTKIMEGLKFSSDIAVFSLQKHVNLPGRRFPEVAIAKEKRDKSLERFQFLKKTSADSQDVRTAEVNWFGSEELLFLSILNEERKLENVYESCLPAEIQIIRIGHYFFAAWPGEIFIEYALALKKSFRNIFLITLANGELQGYVATKDAEEKGLYEASNSIFDYSSGEILVDETIKLINAQA